MHRRATARAGTLGLILTVVAACGGTGPPSGGPTGDPVTATVGPEGGVVTGPDGVSLGVPAGVLASPRSVTLARATPPALQLPDHVTAHGHAYRISVDDDAYGRSPASGFIVALPVPEGVDQERLALALLLAGDDAKDDDDDAWHIVRSRFDPVSGLLLAPKASLLERGDVVRLVSGDTLNSQPASSPAPTSSVERASAICTGWFDGVVVDAHPSVPANVVSFVGTTVEAARARYQAAGFRPFELKVSGAVLSLFPPEYDVLSCDELSYEVSVLPRLDPNKLGSYRPSERVVRVYVTNSLTAAQRRQLTETIFHELFHALGPAYVSIANFVDTGQDFFWEGTAALAQSFANDDSPGRAPMFSRRPVDTKLNDPSTNLSYRAQDFWHAVAERHGLTFPQLVKPFLERGTVDPENIDTVLKAAPFGTGLDDEYRHWVVGQVYDLTNCTVAAGTAPGLLDLGIVKFDSGSVNGLPVARNSAAVGLDSTVYRLQVWHLDDDPIQLALTLRNDWDDGDDPRPVALIRHEVGAGCHVIDGSAFEATDTGMHYRFADDDAVSDYTLVLMNPDHRGPKTGNFLLDPAPVITASVTASTTSLVADTPTPVQFSIPFEDHGANVRQLGITVELGDTTLNFGLDVDESDLVSGFSGAGGTGSYAPSIVIFCSEEPNNPLTLTFQLIDDLEFVSDEESVELTVDYGGCP